jgi:retron-type reverse transcriptase
MYDINTLDQLASELAVSEFELLRFVYRSGEFYRRFKRRKSNGDTRVIHAPDEPLKNLHRAIIKRFLAPIPLPDACTGFRPGKSILSNTIPHCGRRFVFNIDIEDFFASISSERVLGLYLRLGFAFPVACVLTELTTFMGSLPQGAPSSPYLANLIAHSLDMEMTEYCKNRGWTYTRYCDDITISGDTTFTLGDMKMVTEILDSEGFQLNMKKTRFLRRNSAQMVSGLVVNKRPNLPREKRRNIRAMFHQASLNPGKYKERAQELENHLSMLSMLNPHDAEVIKYRAILNQVCAQA